MGEVGVGVGEETSCPLFGDRPEGSAEGDRTVLGLLAGAEVGEA